MEIDDSLLNQVSDFLNTSEGSEILKNLKASLGMEDKNASNSKNEKAGSKESSILDDIDISKILPLIKALSSAKADDKASNLLIALKPLLSDEKQPKIDKAVSFMKILAVLPILEKYGFSLKDFF